MSNFSVVKFHNAGFMPYPFCIYSYFGLPQVIAENLSEEEIKGLKAMFRNMDTDKSGTITYEELKSGLTRLGSRLSETEVKQLMEAVSNSSLNAHHIID